MYMVKLSFREVAESRRNRKSNGSIALGKKQTEMAV
jgi:hypothetical protein